MDLLIARINSKSDNEIEGQNPDSICSCFICISHDFMPTNFEPDYLDNTVSIIFFNHNINR